jgi:hypothetical protein
VGLRSTNGGFSLAVAPIIANPLQDAPRAFLASARRNFTIGWRQRPNDTAKGGMMDDRKGPFLLRKRRLIDMIALALSLSLVLGITVITLQSHASPEQLAKATVTRR